MKPTHPLRLTEDAAWLYEASIVRQQKEFLARSVRNAAAKAEQEIIFGRKGYPATIPTWAEGIADDRNVTNLRTVLMGAYLNHLVTDAKHAAKHLHGQPRQFCVACIVRQEGR